MYSFGGKRRQARMWQEVRTQPVRVSSHFPYYVGARNQIHVIMPNWHQAHLPTEPSGQPEKHLFFNAKNKKLFLNGKTKLTILIPSPIKDDLFGLVVIIVTAINFAPT